MSYRLHHPRPRSPAPIRAPPATLLYDLPQPSSRSPPLSPDTPLFSPPLKSPTSPTSPTGVPRHTPPPHSRSATPTQVTRHDLDNFAALCHAWYFEQDPSAGHEITRTVESLLASQRAPFSRLQASVRAAYHTAVTRRRISEFRAHLSSTHPGGSLSPSARAVPYGKAAKRERFDRFTRFIRTWCTTGMPGTTPFFQALWALFRLQVLPVALGGAGPRRIEWEFDDAVFQESAGKEFMLEAIDVLKGVLGFEEYLPPPSRQHSRAPSDEAQTAAAALPARARPRSPSDPFLDTPTTSFRPPHDSSPQLLPPHSPLNSAPRKEPLDVDAESCEGEPHMRLWTSADLDNPELQSLISLFPVFITRHTLPRFPTTKAKRAVPDLEEGLDISEEGKVDVSCGTGRMWVGNKERRAGWKGSWWHRFAGWWRRLFR